MSNRSLNLARIEKNDEFYTTYKEVAAEIQSYLQADQNAFAGKTVLLPCDDFEQSNFTKYFVRNFDRLRIKKIISSSYSRYSKPQQMSLFSAVDTAEHSPCGRVMIKTAGNVCTYDLSGSGDFRSKEVTAFRDEADIIITNPPFSLLAEFVKWACKPEKKVSILGTINAATYPEVFPLLKNNQLWLGARQLNTDMYFFIPDEQKKYLVENKEEGSAYKIVDGVVMGRLASACWYTNFDFSGRHHLLEMHTMGDNLANNSRLQAILTSKYHQGSNHLHYEFYDDSAILDVPILDAIPSDFSGIMGVPITFLGKYNPNQFDIVGTVDTKKVENYNLATPVIHGRPVYKRIAVKIRESEAITV